MSTPEHGTRRGGWGGVAYASFCYLAFLGTFAYFVAFVNDVGVPRSINAEPRATWPVALAINFGLVLLWGLQHSVMARPRFKAAWTRIVPEHTERATYCLASGLALFALCFGWSPLEGEIWSLEGGAAWAARAVGLGGLVILLGATFEIDHFELFGMKQGWYALRGKTLKAHPLQQRFLYKLVRHPIQLGVFLGMWGTPHLSVSHALFAGSLTLYIFIGLYFEERDLIRQYGARYRAYRESVPKLLPWPRARKAKDASVEVELSPARVATTN